MRSRRIRSGYTDGRESKTTLDAATAVTWMGEVALAIENGKNNVSVSRA
ncbi:hypothetical protein NOC27_3207 [Nitrosococcus oceani AFC27]|nr:hypothetical protein NOC27_3207 [Nitrosococcus oceani AFC27]